MTLELQPQRLWRDSGLLLASPSAYITPIEDVFNSISKTLSSQVSLPTCEDWRIHALRRNRELWEGNLTSMPGKWIERHLELEYLLAERKAQRTISAAGTEPFALPSEHYSEANPFPSLMSPLGSFPRLILEYITGLSVATIDSVLLLGTIYMSVIAILSNGTSAVASGSQA